MSGARTLARAAALGGLLAVAACATDAPAPIEDGGVAPPPPPPTFTYYRTGDLLPGSGTGTPDPTVYAPDIVFPVRDLPTFINTQVYAPGGSQVGGDQCDLVNYSYPWRDNFCEIRSSDRQTLNCPENRVHQGQDLRAGDPALCMAQRRLPAAERRQIPVVALEDGIISYIGSYSVNLRNEGRIYRYMHLNMAALEVAEGDTVSAGDVIGYLSDDFGGTPTTLHLHLEFKHNIDGVGWTWVNPYMSLVRAYERQLGGAGAPVVDTPDGPALAVSAG